MADRVAAFSLQRNSHLLSPSTNSAETSSAPGLKVRILSLSFLLYPGHAAEPGINDHSDRNWEISILLPPRTSLVRCEARITRIQFRPRLLLSNNIVSPLPLPGVEHRMRVREWYHLVLHLHPLRGHRKRTEIWRTLYMIMILAYVHC